MWLEVESTKTFQFCEIVLDMDKYIKVDRHVVFGGHKCCACRKDLKSIKVMLTCPSNNTVDIIIQLLALDSPNSRL